MEVSDGRRRTTRARTTLLGKVSNRETFGSEGVLCGQVQIWGVAFGYKGDLGSALFAYGGELPAGNSFMTGSGGEIRIWGG